SKFIDFSMLKKFSRKQQKRRKRAAPVSAWVLRGVKFATIATSIKSSRWLRESTQWVWRYVAHSACSRLTRRVALRKQDCMHTTITSIPANHIITRLSPRATTKTGSRRWITCAKRISLYAQAESLAWVKKRQIASIC